MTIERLRTKPTPKLVEPDLIARDSDGRVIEAELKTADDVTRDELIALMRQVNQVADRLNEIYRRLEPIAEKVLGRTDPRVLAEIDKVKG
jgi:hypothetical protein